MSEPLRVVAFDLDGTLLDSVNSIVNGVITCWDACGFPVPDKEQIRRIIGLPWEESIRELLPGAGENEFAQIKAYHAEVANGVRPRPESQELVFPGIIEVLDQIDLSGYLLSVITSRSSGRLHELLDYNGIGERFIILKTTDNGPGKPSPFLMNQMLSELGIDKKDAVMVGDTTFDMLMARNAGTTAIGVTWGVHEAKELSEAGAQKIIDKVYNLPSAIDLLLNP